MNLALSFIDEYNEMLSSENTALSSRSTGQIGNIINFSNDMTLDLQVKCSLVKSKE